MMEEVFSAIHNQAKEKFPYVDMMQKKILSVFYDAASQEIMDVYHRCLMEGKMVLFI